MQFDNSMTEEEYLRALSRKSSHYIDSPLSSLASPGSFRSMGSGQSADRPENAGRRRRRDGSMGSPESSPYSYTSPASYSTSSSGSDGSSGLASMDGGRMRSGVYGAYSFDSNLSLIDERSINHHINHLPEDNSDERSRVRRKPNHHPGENEVDSSSSPQYLSSLSTGSPLQVSQSTGSPMGDESGSGNLADRLAAVQRAITASSSRASGSGSGSFVYKLYM